MIKTLYVFRPKGTDWIVSVKKELDHGLKLLLSTEAKLPLDKVDTGCSFHGGYYFTSNALREEFTEKFYKKHLQNN